MVSNPLNQSISCNIELENSIPSPMLIKNNENQFSQEVCLMLMERVERNRKAIEQMNGIIDDTSEKQFIEEESKEE